MTKFTKLKAWILSALSMPRGIIAGSQIAAGEVEKAAYSMRKIYMRYRHAGFDDKFANAVVEESYKAAGLKFVNAGKMSLLLDTYCSRNYYHEHFKTGIA